MNEQVAANPLGTERVGKLMVRYAVPSIISIVVNSLYSCQYGPGNCRLTDQRGQLYRSQRYQWWKRHCSGNFSRRDQPGCRTHEQP